MANYRTEGNAIKEEEEEEEEEEEGSRPRCGVSIRC